MLRSILSVLVLCFVLAQPAFAGPQKWQDPDFNFKKVKTVLLVAPYCEGSVSDEILVKQLQQAYFNDAKIKRVKVLHEKDIVDAITAQTGQDMQTLAKEDVEEAYKLFADEAKKQADVEVVAYVVKYATGSKHIPERITTKTEYEEIEISDEKGNKKKIRYPVTRQEVEPAHDILTLSTELRFEVFDTTTGKKVLIYTDNRYREPSVFESNTPFHMYERSVDKFFSTFSDLVK